MAEACDRVVTGHPGWPGPAENLKTSSSSAFRNCGGMKSKMAAGLHVELYEGEGWFTSSQCPGAWEWAVCQNLRRSCSRRRRKLIWKPQGWLLPIHVILQFVKKSLNGWGVGGLDRCRVGWLNWLIIICLDGLMVNGCMAWNMDSLMVDGCMIEWYVSGEWRDDWLGVGWLND